MYISLVILSFICYNLYHKILHNIKIFIEFYQEKVNNHFNTIKCDIMKNNVEEGYVSKWKFFSILFKSENGF